MRRKIEGTLKLGKTDEAKEPADAVGGVQRTRLMEQELLSADRPELLDLADRVIDIFKD